MNSKVYWRWLCFNFCFFLLAGATTAHASSTSDLSSNPAKIVVHSEDAIMVIEKHYRARGADELTDYLDTLLFENVAARHRAELAYTDIWKSVNLQQPKLQFSASGQSESGTQAVVHFTIDYRLVVTATRETFLQSVENIALLDHVGGHWKIRRVVSASDVGVIPQALGEKEFATWQQDQKFIKSVLTPDPATSKVSKLPPSLPSPTVSQTSEMVSVISSTASITSGELPPPDTTSGLLLSYDFTNTPTDNRIEDLSGNGYYGKLNGPVWTGRNGLYYDGKDDYVKVEGGERLHSDLALTVIGEFIPTSYTHKQWQNLVWKGNVPDGTGGASDCTKSCENREFSLWLNDGAYLHSTSTSKDGVDRGQTFFNTPGSSIAGRTVFAQVIDSTAKNMKVFINGKEAATQTYSSSGLRRTDGPLLIGGGGPIKKDWSLRGYFRWLRIYGRALTKEEVAAITSRKRLKTAEPWRDPYSLDDAVVKGGWATIAPIQDDSYFDKFDMGAIEPGIVIQNGWYSHPTDRQETEILFRHDGSPLRLSGQATLLDCLDYCGSTGQVEMIIRGDAQELWNSGKLRNKGPGKTFEINLTGVHEIRLVTTDGGNGEAQDWAAWLNLKLIWPDPQNPQVPPPVQAFEPPITPQAPIQITDAFTNFGSVDAVYTLNRKPEGSPLVSIKNFPGETEKVVVWFLYKGFEAGDVLTGVWTDIGRQLQLRAVPVVVINEQGEAGFSLRRPVTGWARGSYLVEIKNGNKVLNSVKFNMDN